MSAHATRPRVPVTLPARSPRAPYIVPAHTPVTRAPSNIPALSPTHHSLSNWLAPAPVSDLQSPPHMHTKIIEQVILSLTHIIIPPPPLYPITRPSPQHRHPKGSGKVLRPPISRSSAQCTVGKTFTIAGAALLDPFHQSIHRHRFGAVVDPVIGKMYKYRYSLHERGYPGSRKQGSSLKSNSAKTS